MPNNKFQGEKNAGFLCIIFQFLIVLTDNFIQAINEI